MTAKHDALRDLLAAAALRAATPSEIAQVEEHAASCAVCREELDGYRAAVGGLALAPHQLEPPPALKARIMAEVRSDLASRPGSLRPSSSRSRRLMPGWPRPGLGPWPALAGVLAALTLIRLGWNLSLQGRSYGGSYQVVSLAVRGTAEEPGIRGRVTYIPREASAIVRLSNLPEPDVGKRWELWAIRDGQPVSAGFLVTAGPGEAKLASDDLTGAGALAVTQELPGNTAAPTSEPVTVVELPSQG